nr:polypeptide N-acetylgalactosaminyltransferase 15 isoform X3 [Pelodiscus sinensis]|eukprot:XP_014434148.1 polypeptide N-acetylgalactosaminyltransferase 15 isoform X3 [Pelodiscus sinensis]
MLLKKRCRYGPRKVYFLLLLLVLGFLLLMVTILNPPSRDLHKEGTSQPLKVSSREGYQVAFPETQEMLETQEESQQYYPMEGLSPFISLREDELLVAIESPTARRNHSKARKGYRMVKQQRKRQEEKTDVKPRRDQESQLMSFSLQDAEEADGGEQLAIFGLETHGFNEALSERISLRRELPEVRHPFCLQQDYDPNLPTASVIICFHDEAWSTLLRTVHSVMDTAPKTALKEIILVDDLSQQGHLKSALSEYISKLDGVKLIRSNKRLGVIRGRMLGAARATGDVLVFMDSHCECHTGWLEPLLGRLATDRSPVVPGGVVAMDRHYFQNIGAYDSDMTLWGSENLELSLRAWLCGGSVEILPCSRVGHLFRNHIPRTFSNKEAAVRNKIRIAETWLDSFKEIFYKHDTVAFLISKAEKPDCNNRLQLQKRLGCRKFHWFISNVYPELHPPEYRLRFSGKLYNTGVGFCADYRSAWDAAAGPIELSPCSDSINQHFEYNSMKEIRFGSTLQFCFDVRHEKVILQNCTQEAENSPQQWDVQESGMIVHILSGKCLMAVKSEAEKDLSLHVCNKNENQLWQFDHSLVLDER